MVVGPSNGLDIQNSLRAQPPPMPLIKCRSCNKPRSDLAMVCPHCGDGLEQVRRLAQAPCRTCGAVLERERHLTRVNGVFQHRPCPACGEPYPIAIPRNAIPIPGEVKAGLLEGAAPMIGCGLLLLPFLGLWVVGALLSLLPGL